MCELRMFLRIAGARSAEQFDIIEVKIPFDLNIIYIILTYQPVKSRENFI